MFHTSPLTLSNQAHANQCFGWITGSSATITSCMHTHREAHLQSIARSTLFLSPCEGLPNSRSSVYEKRSKRASGGKINASNGAFFDSPIVQAETDCLQSDFQALLRLGKQFGQFDREGKLCYIDEMKKIVERWQIAYKRMELSGDLLAKHCANQLKTAMGPLGLTNVDLAKSMMLVLDEMRQDADADRH